MKKKLISMLLVLVLMITSIPVTAWTTLAASKDFKPGETGSAKVNRLTWIMQYPELGSKTLIQLKKNVNVTVLEAYIEVDDYHYAHKVRGSGYTGYIRFTRTETSPLTATKISGMAKSRYVDECADMYLQYDLSVAKDAAKKSETASQNSTLYPHPIDMSVLSDYLPNGGTKTWSGETFYSALYSTLKLPEEWMPHKRPDSLPLVGYATFHLNSPDTGTHYILGYFEPRHNVTTNYHKEISAEVNLLGFPYMGAIQRLGMPTANIALAMYEQTEVEVVAYNEYWVAFWTSGGFDPTCALNETCKSRPFSEFMYWKPGVYFIPRQFCYIRDINNHLSKTPTFAGTGTATANLKIKTTPDSTKYVEAGLLSTGEDIPVIDATPINGHYKIYYQSGAYYVNAKYVNLNKTSVKKPTIAYKATVKSNSTINIRAKTSVDSELIASVKNGTVLEVLKKNYNDTYSQIWFNSKKCYIQTKYLTSFKTVTSAADISKLGAPIGVIAVDSPWRAYGAIGYTAAGLKELKKNYFETTIKSLENASRLWENEFANVYKIQKVTYTPDPEYPEYKSTAKIYTTVINGAIRYVVSTYNDPFTYYSGTKYKVSAKAETYPLMVGSDLYMLSTYQLGGLYYCKLTDLAQIFKDTAKSFDIKIDKKKYQINLTMMTQYSGKTTTISTGDGVKRKAYASTYFISCNGDPADVPCYTIKGEYYISVASIAALLNCYVEYGTSFGIYKIHPSFAAEKGAVG